MTPEEELIFEQYRREFERPDHLKNAGLATLLSAGALAVSQMMYEAANGSPHTQQLAALSQEVTGGMRGLLLIGGVVAAGAAAIEAMRGLRAPRSHRRDPT